MSGIFDPGIFDSGIFDTPSGGSSVTRTTTDAPTTSDAATRGANLHRTTSETIATADVATRSGVVTATTTDAPHTSDAATRTASVHFTTTDAPHSSDSATRSGSLHRSATETLTTADVAVRNGGVRTTTDAPHTADAVTRTGSFHRATTESLHTSEVISRHIVNRTTTEAPHTSDVVTRIGSFHKTTTNAPHTADAVTRTGIFSRATTELIHMAETISRHAVIRTTSESIHTSDAVTRNGSFHHTTTEFVRGLTNAIQHIMPPVVSGVAIYIDGVNIAKPDGDPVLFASARFMSAVNGVAGTASFRARDDTGTASYKPGDPLELVINGERAWTGFVSSVKRVYVFPALNVTDFGLTRFFDIEGVDLNILFQKRIAFNKADPANVLAPLYGHFHSDVDAISDLVTDWLDLTGDGIDTSTGVTHVGYINEDQDARGWEGSDTWGQAMTSISMLPASIFYIRPNYQLAYVDDDTPDAPFGLSDQPDAGGGSGSTTTYDDPFARTVASGWGTGPIGTWTDHAGEGATSVTPGDAFSDGTIGTRLLMGVPLPSTGTIGEVRAKFRWPTGGSGITLAMSFANAYPETRLAETLIYRNSDEIDIYDEVHSDFAFTAPILTGGDTAWVALRVDGGVMSAKTWLASGAEPGWQITLPTTHVMSDFSMVLFQNFDLNMDWHFYEVIYTAETGTTPTSKGYREMEILLDGTNLANDVLAWGAGYGKNVPVFKRDQDATSIAEHNRWQLGQLTFGIFKQATINRVADSILNGSPEHHRGQKDDRTAIMVKTYEQGLLPAQKVQFTSNVFGYTDVIPIRKMEITFPTPTTPLYALTLSHEIDAPWSFFDPFRFSFFLPHFNLPPFPPPILPPTTGGCPPICQPPIYVVADDDYSLTYAYVPGSLTVTISGSPVTVVESDPAHGYFTYLTGDHSAGMVACYSANFQFDTFNRVEASTWGMSTDGHTWTTSLLSGASVSVDGASGAQFVNSGTANEVRVETNQGGPWTESAWTMTTDYQPIFSTGGGHSIIDVVNPNDLRVTGLLLDPSASTFGGSAAGSPTVSFAYTSGTHYTVKWEMVSWVGTAQHYRAKIWKTSDPEPAAWMIDYTNASRTPNSVFNYLNVYAKNGSSVGAYLVNYDYINFDYAGKPCFCSDTPVSFTNVWESFDNRTLVPNNWGSTSRDGTAYTLINDAGSALGQPGPLVHGAAWVENGYGKLQQDYGNGGSGAVFGQVTSGDFIGATDWFATIRFMFPSSGAPIDLGSGSSFSENLAVRYSVTGPSVDGTDELAAIGVGPTSGLTPDVWYRAKYQWLGSTGTVQWRVWPDTDAEPPTWDVTRTFTPPRPITRIGFGIRTSASSTVGTQAHWSEMWMDWVDINGGGPSNCVPAPSFPSGPTYGLFHDFATRIDSLTYQLSRQVQPGTLQLSVGAIGQPGTVLVPTVDYTVNNTTGVVTLTNPITDPTTVVQGTYQATGPIPNGTPPTATNLTFTPRPSIPSLPGLLSPVADPTWGTTITRIANSGILPTYSRYQPWNIDQTKILLGFYYPGRMLDGTTYADLGAFHQLSGAIWSNVDPNKLWGVDGSGSNILYTQNATTEAITPFRTFAGYTALAIGGDSSNTAWEGGISDNDRYICITAYGGSGGAHLISYDTVANSILGDILAPAGLDNAQISRLGNYIVTVAAEGTRRWARDFSSSILLTPTGAHADNDLNAAGEEIFVSCNTGVGVQSFRLSDGAVTTLLPPSTAFEYGHTSGRGQAGWVCLSSYDASATAGRLGFDQLILAKTDGSGDVEVFGFANNNQDGSIYADQPHACVSRDGLRILFASTWGGSIPYAFVAG